MSKDNGVFLKKSELSLFIVLNRTSIGVHKTYNLSTHLYDQIYFDRLVQFHPSMRTELYLVRQCWSETLIFMRIQCMYYKLIKCLAP